MKVSLKPCIPMVHQDDLQDLIDSRRSFRIGTRGICCDCRSTTYGWLISIPRAFIDIECDEIGILSDPDFYMLAFSIDKGKSFIDFLDLTHYDKLTVIM